jgi:hypothetical protein
MKMSDAYCRKHFIRYCPDLSKVCPYCRIAELKEANDALGGLIVDKIERIAELRGQIKVIEKVADYNADRVAELERRCNESPDVILQRFMAEELRRKELEALLRNAYNALSMLQDPMVGPFEGLLNDIEAMLGDEK